MPYEWTAPTEGTPSRLQLWPYRSLPRRGFVGFFAITVAFVALPLLSVLGSPVLWFILIFIVLALSGMWMALNRSYRDAEIIENLTLDRDQLTLTRHGPRGRRQDWQANPYWVQIRLHETGGPVPNYLTLKGDGREVELGAFLSEDERLTLKDDLQRRLNALR